MSAQSLSYLLVQSASAAHSMPIAVNGRSKLYGHALYDGKYGSHVFRFSKEEWEGGAGRDITENKHRSLAKWIVLAEVEYNPESELGKMANELDALKAENDSLRLQLQNAITAQPVQGSPEDTALRVEFEAGKQIALDGQSLPDDASAAAREGYRSDPSVEQQAPVLETNELPDIVADCKGKNFRTIRKMAIDEGVPYYDAINDRDAMIAALAAFRQSKA